jgi:hypothetical protein
VEDVTTTDLVSITAAVGDIVLLNVAFNAAFDCTCRTSVP